MAIRMPKRKILSTDGVKVLREKIAALKGEVERLEKRKDEAREVKLLPGQILYRKGMGREFYSCREWRTVRYQVLQENAKKNSGKSKCEQCGAQAGEKPLEVDHVKPRSLFPHLELAKHNLQVLCHDCNQGKGASV
jgi:5-methylcytosine-specific restriction endonuclease McrA